MPSVLLAGSSPEEFPGVALTGTGSGVDVDYTVVGCDVAPGGLPVYYTPLETPTSEVWFHMRHQKRGAAGNVGNNYVFAARDENGNPIGCVTGVSTTSIAARSFGDATVSGSSFSIDAPGNNTVFVFDIQILVTDSEIISRLYNNASLISEAIAEISSDPPVISEVGIRLMRASTAVGYTATVSEMILTDGIPTVGWRLSQRRPAGPGAFSQMQGTWADLVNPDPGAAVVGNADGQRMSWEPTAYGGAMSPANIVAVIGNVQTSRMAGTPSRVNQFLRLNGSNYDAPPKSTNILKRDQDIWWVNPATGQPWVTADFADMEVGIRVTD